MRLHLALICSALIFSSVAAAQATDVITFKNKLAPWQPSEISQKGDQITIVLPDANITPEVYSLIISNSCTPIWTKDAPSNYLKTSIKLT